MPTTVSFADLDALAGTELEPSAWLTIDQARINTFADATDDHQWIHCDPERARTGPFGTPIAHGYLTLSLIVPLFADLLEVADAAAVVNYGLERVRFPSPVPVQSRIRLVAKVVDVSVVGGGGKQLTFDAAVEVEGSDKPACVGRPVFRFYA